MTRRVWLFLGLLAWVACVWVNAGFLVADLQGNLAEYPTSQAESYRSNLGVAWMLSLLPPMWPMTPFMTGFYEHGWMKPTLKPQEPKCTRKN